MEQFRPLGRCKKHTRVTPKPHLQIKPAFHTHATLLPDPISKEAKKLNISPSLKISPFQHFVNYKRNLN
jgi:hypothetical protein